MSSAAAMVAKRTARKAAGLCTECDTPALRGHSVCRRHFDQRAARLKARNEKRTLAGRCYCGARANPGRDRCLTCLEIENRKAHERYVALRATGRCVVCSRKALPGKARCLRCKARAAEYYQNSRERKEIRLARRGQLAARVFTLHAYSITQPAR